MTIGFSVTIINDFCHALQIIENETFSLIISDFDMPIINGALLAEKVRALKITVPILILSGRADLVPKDIGPANSLLHKDSGVSALLATVKRLLQSEDIVPRIESASLRD